jgi:hypothetical protein
MTSVTSPQQTDERGTDEIPRPRGGQGVRLLVLGADADAQRLRDQALAAGYELAQRYSARVSHVAYGTGVDPDDAKYAKIRDAGLTLLPLRKCARELGLDGQPAADAGPDAAGVTAAGPEAEQAARGAEVEVEVQADVGQGDEDEAENEAEDEGVPEDASEVPLAAAVLGADPWSGGEAEAGAAGDDGAAAADEDTAAAAAADARDDASADESAGASVAAVADAVDNASADETADAKDDAPANASVAASADAKDAAAAGTVIPVITISPTQKSLRPPVPKPSRSTRAAAAATSAARSAARFAARAVARLSARSAASKSAPQSAPQSASESAPTSAAPRSDVGHLLLSIVWTLVPFATFGLLTPVTFGYAAYRLRSRALVLAALGYTVAVVASFILSAAHPHSATPSDAAGALLTIALAGTWLGGTWHAVTIRTRVFAR